MSEDLERRLRAADPARPSGHRLPTRDLVEATMTRIETRDRAVRRRWMPAVAAAAATAVLGIGAVTVLLGDDDGGPAASDGAARELALPGSDSMASCVQYSVDVLAGMPTAFAGTVVQTGEESVVLEVDRWYRGGEARFVELTTPSGQHVALNGVVDFDDGERYLVTASEDGTVNSCGFTDAWSEEKAADFETAFGG